MTVTLPDADLEHVLAHTEPLWASLRRERIFVTGGTGFFGRWLLGTLAYANRRLALHASATVLTRDPERFADQIPELATDDAVLLRRGDVRFVESDGTAYACVIHAATESSRIASPSDHFGMFDTIVTGTERTLALAAASRAARALVVSTGAVYGTQPPGVHKLAEGHGGGPSCEDPRSAYAEGKRAAEVLASIHAAEGLGVSVARCFAFVGPHLPLDAHFAVGNFIRDALSGGPIRLTGDGTAVRSYLYAADLAIWLWTIALRGAPGRAYNVGAERAISVGDLAMLVAETVGNNCRVERSTVEPLGPPHRYVPTTERARSELGLTCRIPLEDAITRTVEWHRSATMNVAA